MEQFIAERWAAWLISGGLPDAIASTDGEAWILKLNSRYQRASWAGLGFMNAFFLALILAMWNVSGEEAYLVITAGVLAVVLNILYGIGLVYVLGYRLELTRQGMTLFQAYYSPMRLFWDDLTVIRFGDPGPRFQFSDGKTTIPVSPYLDGLTTLRRCLVTYGSSAVKEQVGNVDDVIVMCRVSGWDSSADRPLAGPFASSERSKSADEVRSTTE